MFQPAWSKKRDSAYWINAYNAYTVKLIIDNYPTKYKDISDPWVKNLFAGKKIQFRRYRK
jgi:hypothetical protein